MPIKHSLSANLAGYSLSCALDGEDVLVATEGVYFDHDGRDFVSFLEAIASQFDTPLDRAGILPSQVDHLLAIIEPNGETTIYCNELQIRILCRARRRMNAGQPVTNDDVADIHELRFFHAQLGEITVPDNCGVVALFSASWRRCGYFDFSLFHSATHIREANLPERFGRLYATMQHSGTYALNESQLERLADLGWFPFIGLNQQDRDKIVVFGTCHSNPSPVFAEVCESFRKYARERFEDAEKSPFLHAELPFIDRALDRFEAGDYLSCVSLIYPKIEGILRQILRTSPLVAKVSQRRLADAAASSVSPHSLLLPVAFGNYLVRFFFKAFDEANGDIPLSRNSVAHGVANARDFDLCRAAIGLLILNQLFFLTPKKRVEVDEIDSESGTNSVNSEHAVQTT